LSILEKALSHSKKRGMDECEIVTVEKKTTTVRITDSEIVEIKQNFDKKYGIRIIHQKKIVSIQTTDSQNIEKDIDNIFETISNFKPREFWKGLPYKVSARKIEGTFDDRLEEISGKNSMDIAQSMINSADNEKINTITKIQWISLKA